ncbi:MAG: protein kinase [Actinomycetota bacterium]
MQQEEASGRRAPVLGDNVAIPGLADLTEIGRGGFGVVYRATESELGREVAVKLLSGPLDERSRSRFERERRAMGVLSSHPNIVTVFRSGTAGTGEPYLVMEYLPGGSFADRLQASGPVPWHSALAIGVELCGALESAHRAGVLHRDVKPGNIMVDALGRAQLGDFGIARLDGSPETKSSVITASVAHAPPEVVAGEKPDERSDIYSLSSTLFELVSGSPAFVRATDESMIPLFNRIVNDPMPDLRQRGVPDALAVVLERAMAKQREDRHRSAAEFGQSLLAVQRSLGLPEARLWLAGDQPPTVDDAESTRTVSPPASSGDYPPPGSPPQAPPTPNPGMPAPSLPDPSWPQPAAPAAAGSIPAAPPATPGPGPAPAPDQPLGGFAAPPQNPGYANPAPAPQPIAGYSNQPGQAIGAGTGYLPPPNAATPGGVSTSGRIQPPNQPSRLPWFLAGAAALVLVVVTTFAVASRSGDDEDDGQEVQALQGDGDQDGDADSGSGVTVGVDSGSPSGPDSSEPDVEQTTTTTAPTTTAPTVPPRSALLANLPSLPSVEGPYTDFKTISDPDRSFIVDVPTAWVDVIPSQGQVIVSPDNNAALADENISGGIVSGSQGIGVWDADFFLDALIENAADADDPCSQVARDIYDDGVFDGLLYAEFCNGGELLVVTVLASDPNRQTVFLVSAQMTDERDMAAFQEMLDSFVLLDPTLLPVVE